MDFHLISLLLLSQCLSIDIVWSYSSIHLTSWYFKFMYQLSSISVHFVAWPICLFTVLVLSVDLSFLFHTGCLLQYLRNNRHLVEKTEIILDMAIQICSAMKFLEATGFIHRDLVSVSVVTVTMVIHKLLSNHVLFYTFCSN